MTIEDKKAVTRIKRLLTRCVNLHLKACGFDSEVAKAVDAQLDVVDAVEQAIEASGNRVSKVVAP